MLKIYGGWWLTLQTPSLNESRSAHPCIPSQQSISQSIHPSIRLSIYPSDLASTCILAQRVTSTQAGSHTHAHNYARTHMHTFKSTHPSIRCQSVLRPHTHTHTLSTHTLEHAHTNTYIYAYSPDPVAQFAVQQICNLPSVQGSWSYRTQIQANNFRGDWSWDSFYSHSLSTAQSSKQLSLSMCSLYW